MTSGENGQSGFSIVEAVVIVAAISIVGAAGLFVSQHNRTKATNTAINLNATAIPSQTTSQPLNTSSAQPSYAAWPARSNTAYGFSYNYPTNWMPSGDVTNDPKTSATRQEFGTGLKLNATTENGNTVEIEVLDEPLQTAEAWYDQYYAQTPIKVNKTIAALKGKQSVQYDFVAPTYESKRYLFAVGSKTYMFTSVNESQNVSASATYWSDFDNTFSSLTIK